VLALSLRSWIKLDIINGGLFIAERPQEIFLEEGFKCLEKEETAQ
jgi:hypothetical protein